MASSAFPRLICLCAQILFSSSSNTFGASWCSCFLNCVDMRQYLIFYFYQFLCFLQLFLCLLQPQGQWHLQDNVSDHLPVSVYTDHVSDVRSYSLPEYPLLLIPLSTPESAFAAAVSIESTRGTWIFTSECRPHTAFRQNKNHPDICRFPRTFSSTSILWNTVSDIPVQIHCHPGSHPSLELSLPAVLHP